MILKRKTVIGIIAIILICIILIWFFVLPFLFPLFRQEIPRSFEEKIARRVDNDPIPDPVTPFILHYIERYLNGYDEDYFDELVGEAMTNATPAVIGEIQGLLQRYHQYMDDAEPLFHPDYFDLPLSSIIDLDNITNDFAAYLVAKRVQLYQNNIAFSDFKLERPGLAFNLTEEFTPTPPPEINGIPEPSSRPVVVNPYVYTPFIFNVTTPQRDPSPFSIFQVRGGLEVPRFIPLPTFSANEVIKLTGMNFYDIFADVIIYKIEGRTWTQVHRTEAFIFGHQREDLEWNQQRDNATFSLPYLEPGQYAFSIRNNPPSEHPDIGQRETWLCPVFRVIIPASTWKNQLYQFRLSFMGCDRATDEEYDEVSLYSTFTYASKDSSDLTELVVARNQHFDGAPFQEGVVRSTGSPRLHPPLWIDPTGEVVLYYVGLEVDELPGWLDTLLDVLEIVLTALSYIVTGGVAGGVLGLASAVMGAINDIRDMFDSEDIIVDYMLSFTEKELYWLTATPAPFYDIEESPHWYGTRTAYGLGISTTQQGSKSYNQEGYFTEWLMSTCDSHGSAYELQLEVWRHPFY